jgi:fido (protein-threonine AMPylation protein)
MKQSGVSLNSRQLRVIKFFETNPKGAVLDIFELLDGKVSRITIVRDLQLLCELGYLIQTGAGRGVEYYLSPSYAVLKPVDIESYFVISQDDRGVDIKFNFDIFKLLADTSIFTEEEQIHLNKLHSTFVDNFASIDSDVIKHKEFERIIIEFAWKSSQIEGNTYSLLDTESLIRSHESAVGKSQEETQMILNHKEAFDFVIEHQRGFKVLKQPLIEKTHQILVQSLNITHNLRKAPVGIVGTNYRPLDNMFHIKEAIQAMIKLVNSTSNVFEKSFFSLILLSYIQGFEDGNKRTARLISNAMLIAFGYTPLSYRGVSETEYKKASILFYETNNITYFKKIFIEQYEFAVNNYFQSVI